MLKGVASEEPMGQSH